MKKIVAITLSVLFLSASVKDSCICAFYLLNIDYISEVLCINKDNPEMECNGQCYLESQLEDASDASNTTAPKFEDSVQFVCDLPYRDASESYESTKKQSHFYGMTLLISSYLEDVFHPPQLKLLS